MFTIDTHTHIIPRHLPDFGKQFGRNDYIMMHHHEPNKAWMIQGEKRFREVAINCWDASVRLAEMAEHGIDQQVICTIPVMFNYDKPLEQGIAVSRFLNDDLASVLNQHTDKFIGLATVPLQDTNAAIAELERAMGMGYRGVQIGSNINQKNLGDDEFQEFFAACESLGAAILIHPWKMMGEEHMQKYWLPWLVGMPAEISRAACSMIFSGVLERYPKLRVCCAHGGGSFLPTISRIEHGWECRPDLVAIDNKHNPKSYLGKFWVDSHVCDHKMLQYVIDLIGADKVMQGSDYPFPLGEAIPGELVRTAPLSDSAKAMILGGAAKSWLGL